MCLSFLQLLLDRSTDKAGTDASDRRTVIVGCRVGLDSAVIHDLCFPRTCSELFTIDSGCGLDTYERNAPSSFRYRHHICYWYMPIWQAAR